MKHLLIFILSTLAAHSTQTEERAVSRSDVFTPPGAALLQARAAEVLPDELLSQEVQALIDRMMVIAGGERDDTGGRKGVMVGLAAPQIGVQKRVILVDVGVDSDRKNLGTLVAYINPEITWASSDMVEGREGCFSVDPRVVGMVPRAQSIRMKALDRHGAPVEAEWTGMTARIFQHEVDHLNGIRFPERVGPEGKLHWVEASEYVEYKTNCANWQCKCPWNVWVAMKEGRPYSHAAK